MHEKNKIKRKRNSFECEKEMSHAKTESRLGHSF